MWACLLHAPERAYCARSHLDAAAMHGNGGALSSQSAVILGTAETL
jgi:hypothetical protein